MKTLILIAFLSITIFAQNSINVESLVKIDSVQNNESLNKLQLYEDYHQMSFFILGIGIVMMVYSHNESRLIFGFGTLLSGIIWSAYNKKMIEKYKKELTAKSP